jgi:NIMA (never in mitosis gene a)-related kinase
MYSED